MTELSKRLNELNENFQLLLKAFFFVKSIVFASTMFSKLRIINNTLPNSKSRSLYNSLNNSKSKTFNSFVCQTKRNFKQESNCWGSHRTSKCRIDHLWSIDTRVRKTSESSPYCWGGEWTIVFDCTRGCHHYRRSCRWLCGVVHIFYSVLVVMVIVFTCWTCSLSFYMYLWDYFEQLWIVMFALVDFMWWHN